MIRKYLSDIVAVVAILLIVALVAVWQSMALKIQPQSGNQSQFQKKNTQEKNVAEPESVLIQKIAADALKKRNIFAETGSYIVVKKVNETPPVEKNYTLIAVLGGKEHKAVIRDEQGVVTFCKVGGKLSRWQPKKTAVVSNVPGRAGISASSGDKKQENAKSREDKDVFTVVKIDATSVKLKSKTETKELKIFNVQYKPPKR